MYIRERESVYTRNSLHKESLKNQIKSNCMYNKKFIISFNEKT